MNPREFLRETGYPFAVLTTYTFDPHFFDRLILPDLWAGESRSVLVLADSGETDRAFERLLGELRHLGRRYFLVDLPTPKAFHPKVFARLGDEGGIVWLGSGNLTRGGWGANRELASAWAVGPEAEDSGGWLTSFFQSYASQLDGGLESELFRRVLSRPWLEAAPDPDPLTDRVITSQERSLASQLGDRWGGRTFQRLDLMTGSTDPNGAFLRWAVDRFGIERIRICVTPEHCSFLEEPLQEIDAEVEFIQAVPDKRVHAKLFWFEGEEGAAVAWGSANCSAQAWLSRPGNVEAVCLDDSPDPTSYAHVLELFESDLGSPADFIRAAPEDDAPSRSSGSRFRIAGCTWDAHDGLLSLTIMPEPPVGSACFLECDGDDVELEPTGNRWVTTHFESGRKTLVVRVRVELSQDRVHWTPFRWVNSLHELREVVSGRDFRGILTGLRLRESGAADRRLADEIGRIALEILRDAQAFPDPRPRRRGKQSEEERSDRGPVDRRELLRSVREIAPPSELGSEHASDVSGIVGLGGIFRALFTYLDAEAREEAEVHPDERAPEEPRSDSDNRKAGGHGDKPEPTPDDVDDRTRRRLKRHMERFLDEFEDPAFGERSKAGQLVQAVSYPIGVALMGENRGWCSEDDFRSWIERPLRHFLQRDRFTDRQPLLSEVAERYRAASELARFTAATGDGALWVTLCAGVASLSPADSRDSLALMTIYRDLYSHETLLEAASPSRLRFLLQHFRDQDAIEKVKDRVISVGEDLYDIERRLRDEAEELIAKQQADGVRHVAGDWMWHPKRGWGLAIRDEDEEGEHVDVYMIEAREEKTFQARGHFVNVSELGRRGSALGEAVARLQGRVQGWGEGPETATKEGADGGG